MSEYRHPDPQMAAYLKFLGQQNAAKAHVCMDCTKGFKEAVNWVCKPGSPFLRHVCNKCAIAYERE